MYHQIHIHDADRSMLVMLRPLRATVFGLSTTSKTPDPASWGCSYNGRKRSTKRCAEVYPHLEDVIRQLLAAEKDLPPTNVINQILSGEFIRRPLDSGRYETAASKLPGLDYVLARYGLNDNVINGENLCRKLSPNDHHELIGRLKTDHPVYRWL